MLGQSVNSDQRTRLEKLLTIADDGGRQSWFDKLRKGPVRISAPALVKALERVDTVRALGITLPGASNIPQSRLASLARFAGTAKVTAINPAWHGALPGHIPGRPAGRASLALMRLQSVRELGIRLPAATRIPATRVAALARFAGPAKASAILRLPVLRRLATLVAFVQCLEASAQDDALEVLEVILRELFGDAVKADKKSRLRSLKDLDEAAATSAGDVTQRCGQ